MKYPKSDHCDGSVFFNPGVEVTKSLFEILKWQVSKVSTAWPVDVTNTSKPQVATSVDDSQVVTTFINHATYLLQLKDLNILTDPLFSQRASPLAFAGPKRVRRPGLEITELPRIDVVLLSHNHYDHMDRVSLEAIIKKFDPLFITPLGNGAKLKSFGARKVVELDWWQTTAVPGSDVRVSVVPAQHWSKRELFDTNHALWGGFVVEAPRAKIFFAGDTGYAGHFAEIFKRFGAMSISLLPIGAYEPRWFMKVQHMNPAEAVQAHLDLHSQHSLGIHFGTFKLTDEGIFEPVTSLASELANKNVKPESFHAPDNGETITFSF